MPAAQSGTAFGRFLCRFHPLVEVPVEPSTLSPAQQPCPCPTTNYFQASLLISTARSQEVTMTHRRTHRQAQQRAATARAAASQRGQDAIIRMASEMGIPTKDISPANPPVLAANYQNPDAVAEALDIALGQIPPTGLRRNPTPRVITDASALAQQTNTSRPTTTTTTSRNSRHKLKAQ